MSLSADAPAGALVAPPAAPPAEGLLVLDLRPIAVDASEARVVDGLIAETVGDAVRTWPAAKRPRIVTGNDIRTLVTIDAERAAVGCDDETSSCMAEIAGALGARYVVSGTLGALGSDRVLQLSLFDVKTGEALERGSATAPSPSALAPAIPDVVARVLRPLASTTARAPRKDSGVSGLAIGGAVTGGIGSALAIGGGIAALVLDVRLAPRSEASPGEKRDALAYGPAVVIASAAGGALAIGGFIAAAVGFADGGAE